MKNEKISCPVYLLFTEKVNFLLVNKEKNSQFKKSKQIRQLIFCFCHFHQITKNELTFDISQK